MHVIRVLNAKVLRGTAAVKVIAPRKPRPWFLRIDFPVKGTPPVYREKDSNSSLAAQGDGILSPALSPLPLRKQKRCGSVSFPLILAGYC